MPREINTPKRTGDFKYNLLSSLGTQEFDGRFLIEGVTWEREPCDLPDALDLTVCPADPLPKADADTSPGEAALVLPQGITAAFTCSPVGFTKQDAIDKATAILDNGRVRFIGNYWANELATDPLLGLILVPGVTGPECGLALAQEDVVRNFGRAATIYAPPSVVSRWTETHAVSEGSDGNLYTALGNLVIVLQTLAPVTPVPGATPTTRFIYVRDSRPSVYLSEVSVLSTEPDAIARRNDVRARVEQTFLIADDPCISFAVPVDFCV